MSKIQIGDIIEPITTKRHQKLGKGIIVSIKHSQHLPVTAVFPTGDGSFINYDFKEKHVRICSIKGTQLVKIMKADRQYRELMVDLRRA